MNKEEYSTVHLYPLNLSRVTWKSDNVIKSTLSVGNYVCFLFVSEKRNLESIVMPTINSREKVIGGSYEINCTLYPPLFFFLFYLFLVKGMTIFEEIIIHICKHIFINFWINKNRIFFLLKIPFNNCPPLITSPNCGKCCGCVITI